MKTSMLQADVETRKRSGQKTMKAAILIEQNKPLVLGEVEIPKLEVGQILVRVKATSICGKQIDEIQGRRVDPHLPHLLGHEGSGIVVEVGPGVQKVKEGEHCVLHWMKGLGIDSAPPRYAWNGTQVSAGWVTTFNEWAIVSENRLTPIPEDFPYELAALLGCAVTTGVGIVLNDLDLKPAQSIAVFGVGGIGLNVIQGASLVNAFPIVAVDLHAGKLEDALMFGATHGVNAQHSDLKSYLLRLSNKVGFDACVDTTGNKEVRELAYECSGETGKTLLAGVPFVTDRMTIDSFPLHFGRRIQGSHGGSTFPDTDIPRCIALYERGKVKLKELISHTFSLPQINEAIDCVRRGKARKCIVTLD